MTWERALSMVSFGRLVRLRASSTEATIFGVGIFLGATAKFSPFARIDCWGWVRDFEERFTTQFLGEAIKPSHCTQVSCDKNIKSPSPQSPVLTLCRE